MNATTNNGTRMNLGQRICKWLFGQSPARPHQTKRTTLGVEQLETRLALSSYHHLSTPVFNYGHEGGLMGSSPSAYSNTFSGVLPSTQTIINMFNSPSTNSVSGTAAPQYGTNTVNGIPTSSPDFVSWWQSGMHGWPGLAPSNTVVQHNASSLNLSIGSSSIYGTLYANASNPANMSGTMPYSETISYQGQGMSKALIGSDLVKGDPVRALNNLGLDQIGLGNLIYGATVYMGAGLGYSGLGSYSGNSYGGFVA